MRRPLAARWAHTQVPAHLSHQPPGFLHLVPRERLEVLLSELFDGAISRPLRITGIIVVVIKPFVRSTAALTLPHLWTQFAALLVAAGIEMLRQALEQALTTLNLKRPQRLRGKVIAILLGVHGLDAPSAFCRVLRSSLPPTLSTSSWYLSNAPSVSRTGPSTRSSWLRANTIEYSLSSAGKSIQ